MSDMIITAGSITTAVRIKKKLNSMGINAYVIHTPSVINSGGCSYSVKISSDFYNYIIKLKNENVLSFRKIYIEESSGRESVYRDLS